MQKPSLVKGVSVLGNRQKPNCDLRGVWEYTCLWQVGSLALGKVQSHEEDTGHLKPLESWRYGSDQTTWYPGRTTHPGHNQAAGCVALSTPLRVHTSLGE